MNRPKRVGLLPAAFNPPTRAHLGLAATAQQRMDLDEVVFVLPRVLPHKQFDETSFEHRSNLVRAAIEGRPGWSAWVASGGLFLEIAREYRQRFGPGVEIFLLCGRDAAERIVNWDYGEGPSFAEQLHELQLVVAARHGEYAPPAELAERIHCIEFPVELQTISSSAVRQAVASGQPWRDALPPAVARLVAQERLYV